MSERTAKVYEFARLEQYDLKQRLTIRLAGLVFYWLIRIIGTTIRFEGEGLEHFDEIKRAGKQPIYSFWHDRIFIATYYFRDRGITVLTSSSLDGEYIARCIQRFGFGVIKGSSTRGGIQALVGMIRMMKQGFSMAFTIDGPKGPRYEAKPGPILLAKKTGNPLIPFVIECKRFRVLKSWDRMQIPKPFTRAKVMIGEPIYVAPDARDEQIEEKRQELQAVMDELVERAAEWRRSSG